MVMDIVLRKKFLIAILILAIAGAGWTTLSRSTITMPISRMSEFDQIQFWSHRGLGDHQFPENTPAAVTHALSQGFTGVEIDIHYISKSDQILVTHDLDPGGSNGVPLDMFEFPGKAMIWLDFKNLGSLNRSEISAFANNLRRLGLAGRSYVESKSITQLWFVKEEGLRVILWLSGWKIRFLPITKLISRFGAFTAVSCSLANLTIVSRHFTDRSIFTFTENDPRNFKSLIANKKVAVVLTDRARSTVNLPNK